MPAAKQLARWIAKAVKNAAARIVIPFRRSSRNRVNPKGRGEAKIASPPPFLCFCPVRRQRLPSPRRGPNGMTCRGRGTMCERRVAVRPGPAARARFFYGGEAALRSIFLCAAFFAALAAERPVRETRPLQARPPGKCRGKRAAQASCRGGVSPPASPRRRNRPQARWRCPNVLGETGKLQETTDANRGIIGARESENMFVNSVKTDKKRLPNGFSNTHRSDLLRAPLSAGHARRFKRMTQAAIDQQLEYGLTGDMDVPRMPGKIHLRK